MRFPAFRKKVKVVTDSFDNTARFKSPKNVCPYCGTRFKYESMASTCMKTDMCKKYNMPSDRVRYEWGVQSGTTAMVIFLSRILEDFSNTKEKAIEIRELATKLCYCVKYTYPVGKKIAVSYEEKMLNTIAKVWPVGSPIKILRVLRVATTLVDDVIIHNSPLWSQKVDKDGEKYWNELFTCLSQMYGILNPENIEDPEEEKTCDDYDFFHDYLWGALKKQADPSVYYVNDRFWVVARNRQQVRDHMKQHFGLVNTKIRGLPLSAKLDDGSLVLEMLDKIEQIPDIVISLAKPY